MIRFANFVFRLAIAVAVIGLTPAKGQYVRLDLEFVPVPLPVLTKYKAESGVPAAPWTFFALPVYRTSPARDFYSMGQVSMIGEVRSSTLATRFVAVESLAKEALKRGADAIILVPPYEGRYCQATAIKWAK